MAMQTRRTLLVGWALGGVMSGLGAVLSGPVAARPLNKFGWTNRPFVTIAPGPEHDFLAIQRAEFSGQEARVKDRDMVLIEVVGDRVTVDGAPSVLTTAEAVRSFYGVAADDFTVLLVGKDGGVKMRSRRPLRAGEIFEEIDAMPMRQREMGRGSDG